MQNLALHWLTLLVANFLFPESLVEIFSNPKKDHQMAYKLKKKKKDRIENKKQQDWALKSPHVKESKRVVDSGFHTVDSGFRRLDSGFQTF